MVVVVFRSYQRLREFDVVFTLTKGGPARATETLTYHIYARMFEAGQIGISAAIAYFLFFITLAIVVFLFTQLERGDQELAASTGAGSILQPSPIRNARAGIAFVINLPLRIAVALIDLLADKLGNITARATVAIKRGQAASAVGRRERRRLGVVIASAIVGGWIIFALLPVVWIFISSVKEPPDVFKIPPKWIFTPTLHNYEVVHGMKYGTESELVMEGVKPPLSRFREYIINSVLISGSTTLINITAGMLAAYALVRLRFRGKEFILVGMLFTRMAPPIIALKELLDDGPIGRPFVVNAEIVMGEMPAKTPEHWIWDPDNGNGAINENTCHVFDAICFLLGDPVSLHAYGGERIRSHRRIHRPAQLIQLVISNRHVNGDRVGSASFGIATTHFAANRSRGRRKDQKQRRC